MITGLFPHAATTTGKLLRNTSVIMKVILLLATTVVIVSGRMADQLPGGFRIKPGFSCEGREYGFYADVDNTCRAYHVCQPIIDEADQLVEIAHFTFLCGQDTIFDQEQLACDVPKEAYPCEGASSIYDSSNLQLRLEAEKEEKPVQATRP